MTSKERAKLRAEANGLDPIFQIGKEGVTDAVIAQIEDTFNTRELFKIRVHLESSPEGPKEIATKISEATGCDVVQVIGSKFILYKESKATSFSPSIKQVLSISVGVSISFSFKR